MQKEANRQKAIYEKRRLAMEAYKKKQAQERKEGGPVGGMTAMAQKPSLANPRDPLNQAHAANRQFEERKRQEPQFAQTTLINTNK